MSYFDKTNFAGQEVAAMPLFVPAPMQQLLRASSATETTFYLKIFLSTRQFSTAQLTQLLLPLEPDAVSKDTRVVSTLVNDGA